jgi:CrcB protein
MITTLWVAIGGALGSIARYWMAIGVARLTGPAFPWGTILINILGSFVIGLFAAATAPGTGRMAVPTDFRTFVMVGICGGFTTFSSFSLQTLELIRQNQMPQAAANILLSVFLCLAAVGLGYYSGGPAGTVAKLLFEQSSRG